MRLVTVMLAATLAACSSAQPDHQEPAPQPATASSAEVEAAFRARRDSARLRFTAADARFMTAMIAHHAQALVMAGLAQTHEAGSEVGALAARIINAQRDEIALMQGWLRDRGQPAPEVRIEGTTLHVGGEHAPHAPGMLTDAQLAELDRARGPEFDRLFLTYMIQHHRGAVTTVQELFATDGAGQDAVVFRFASDVQADQSTEIARMERMLAALPASSGP
jgi:uncharacterized protein (DUF305 family)